MPHQPPPASEAVLALLDRLLLNGAQVNLERRGGRWRLRYRDPGESGAPRRRHSAALPDDAAAQARTLLEAARLRRGGGYGYGRRARRVRDARQALRTLRRKALAASDRGRWIRTRIGRVFDLAAVMGVEVLENFIAHAPWRAAGQPPGRPSGE
jgi:hypothetical protein